MPDSKGKKTVLEMMGDDLKKTSGNKSLSWQVLLLIGIVCNLLAKFVPILGLVGIICLALAVVAALRERQENKKKAKESKGDSSGPLAK